MGKVKSKVAIRCCANCREKHNADTLCKAGHPCKKTVIPCDEPAPTGGVGVPAEPDMHGIGILTLFDPAAPDQADIDRA